MSSVSRTARVAAIGLIAAGLSLAVAQPAMAFSDPNPTFTATPSHPDEQPLLTLLASCPTGSLSVRVDRNGTDSGGDPYSVTSVQTLDGSGEWTDTFYDDQFFARGSTYTYVVNCFNGPVVAGLPTGANTGNTTLDRVAVDSNAVVNAPASVPFDTATTATGDCGDSDNIATYSWRLYDQDSNELASQFYNPYVPGGYSIPIPSGESNGLAEGDAYTIVVFCDSTVPTNHTASGRSAVITLAAAVPAPVGGAALAATGVEATAVTAAGGVLLIAGAVLLLSRRRRAAIN